MMILLQGHRTDSDMPPEWRGMTLSYFEITGEDVPPVKVTRAHEGQYGTVDASEMADVLDCPDAAKYTTVTRVG